MIGRTVGPYRILSLLGSGGMGDVFLAEDPRLERRVALKCPSDTWLTQPDARERLRREARAAARLQHPNIAAVYDVLDVDERPFIVMEYVEGESLGQTMRRQRLPLGQSVQIAIQITEAVAEAHANGVLHRDLKPGNIRITPDGKVKVLDFGLAHVRPAHVDPSTPHSADSIRTAAGQILGTPGYAAPEQISGGTADQRSDLYAIGVMLFEMVTGQPLFAGEDPMGLALATVTQPVPSVQTINPSAPPDLAAAVAHALEKDPANRPQSALHYASALRRVAAGLAERPTGALADTWVPAHPRVAPATVRLSRRLVGGILAGILAVLGIVAVMKWATSRASSEISGPPVVAVKPFANLSGDPANDPVGSGVADTVRTSLAAVAGISVVSSDEVLEAVTRYKTDVAVARRLGATWLVGGSVQQAAGRLQVNASLVGGDGRARWGAVYQGEPSTLFGLQHEIATAVADRIRGSLTETDRRQMAAAQTGDVAAMSAYFQGREALERAGSEHLDSAVAAFENATRIDPKFALAYAGLGEACWQKYQVVKDRVWKDRAVDAAEAGRRLAPDQPAIRYALAVIYHGIGKRAEAIEELDRVLALNPGDDNAHRLLGDIYVGSGDRERGITEYQRALAIRPRFWRTYRSLGLAYVSMGRHEEAIAAFTRIIELQPEEATGYALRGRAYHARSLLTQAAADYDEAIKRGVSPATSSNIGTFYYQQGRYEDASRAYQKAIAQRPKNAITHRNLADAYRKLERPDDARASYEQAISLFGSDLEVNPNDARALSQLAVCEARLGRAGDAVAHATRAHMLAPSDSEVVYSSGAALAIAGEIKRALELVARGISLGYSADLARIDDDLENLSGMPAFQALVRNSVPPKSGQGGR